LLVLKEKASLVDTRLLHVRKTAHAAGIKTSRNAAGRSVLAYIKARLAGRGKVNSPRLPAELDILLQFRVCSQ